MKKPFIRYIVRMGIILLLGLSINTYAQKYPNNEHVESSDNKVLSISGDRPNIIMFVMDDLNDWVTPLDYDQVKTPNLDRLAKSGVIFKNAGYNAKVPEI